MIPILLIKVRTQKKKRKKYRGKKEKVQKRNLRGKKIIKKEIGKMREKKDKKRNNDVWLLSELDVDGNTPYVIACDICALFLLFYI